MKILSGKGHFKFNTLIRYIGVGLIVLLWGYYAIAQQGGLKPLKTHYKNQNPQSCLNIFQDSTSDILQIILIRHGEPDLNKKGWRRRNAAIEFAENYDKVGIIPFNDSIHCLESIKTDKVYHSSIPRARHTAQLLFENDLKLIGDPRFREFERKVMGFINMKLPLGFWLGTSRVLWLMGFNDDQIESFKQAKARARKNALFLEEEAKADGQAILIAHGLHNRYVMKYLKKGGWEIVNKGGNGYLAVNVLAKRKPDDEN